MKNLVLLALAFGLEVCYCGPRCGKLECVSREDVVCNEETEECVCPPGFRGDGRFECIDPSTTRLCILHGDPHVTTFNQHHFRLHFPCNSVVTEFKTPSIPQIPKGCHVVVTGMSDFPENTTSPQILTETDLQIFVTTPVNTFYAGIDKTGFYKKTLNRVSKGKRRRRNRYQTGKIRVETGDDYDGYFVTAVSPCDVRIKYRPYDGSVTIEAPVKSKMKRGVCGTYKNTLQIEDQATKAGLTAQAFVLRDQLAQLLPISPKDGSVVDKYDVCSKLSNLYDSSAESLTEIAVEFCGLIVTNTEIARCLGDKIGQEESVERFYTCYSEVCQNKSPCSLSEKIFEGCEAAMLTKYLKNNC